MAIKDIIVPLAVHFGFIPVITGLFFIKKLNAALRLFLFILIVSLATDLISYYGYYVKALANMNIFNIYNLVDSILTLCVLYLWIDNRTIKKTILVLMPFLAVLWTVFASPWSGNFHKFSTLYVMLTGAINTLLISYNLYYYTENKEGLSKTPEFWILVGLFIYNFCPLFIEAVAGSILMNKVWVMYNVISITSCMFFTRGFLTFLKWR